MPATLETLYDKTAILADDVADNDVFGLVGDVDETVDDLKEKKIVTSEARKVMQKLAAAAAGVVVTDAQGQLVLSAVVTLAELNRLAGLGDTVVNLLAGKVSTSIVGQPSGVASLDSGGLVPASQMPAIAITDIFEVADQTAMLALTAERGDVAIRLDLNKCFALATNSPSTLADWKELKTPTDTVLSIAGLTGTISASDLKTAIAIAIGDVAGLSTALSDIDTAIDSVGTDADNAQTAANTAQADIDAHKNLATAKGDLLVATAAGVFTALAAGANGKVLTAASGEASGLKWETPAGGSAAPLTMGLPLTGAKFVTAGINAGSGSPLDLYTVPSGKRCLITGAYAQNNSGSRTGTFGWQLYINGGYVSYCPTAVNPTSNNVACVSIKGIVLEAGEKIAFLAPEAGFSGRFRGIEFDDTVKLYSPRVYSVAAAQNTLYTCPSGFNAILINAARPGAGDSEIYAVYQASGGSVSYSPYLVPNGGTPDTTNIFGMSLSALTNTQTGPTSTAHAATLASGDFLSILSNSAHASQLLWCTVLELPN